MRRTLLTTLALLAAGCGDELSNAVFAEDARFLDAVPRAEALRLAGPGDRGAAEGTLRSALGEEPPAELYVLTRKTILSIDHTVIRHLRDVERLVAGPPAERAPGRRLWGPFRHPLDPLESRFVVTRVADDAFEYALELRPLDAAEGTPVITGRWAPGDDGGAERGRVTFDLDALGRLTGAPARGQVDVTYALDGDGARLWIELLDFAPSPDADPQGSAFAYRRGPEGGEFEFTFRTEAGDPVGVRSRWTADGAGRADARVESAPPVTLTECWDDRFARTFFAEQPRGDRAGDPEACPFAEAELPGVIPPPEAP